MEIKINLFSLFIAIMITILSCCFCNYDLTLCINGRLIFDNQLNILTNILIFFSTYFTSNYILKD